MRNLRQDEFIQYTYVSGIEGSKDLLGYSVHKADLDDNKYLSNIWLYNTKLDTNIKLTAFNNEAGFQWHQDGEHIIFSSIRDPKDKEKLDNGHSFTQFYKIAVSGGEADKYFTVPLKVTGLTQVTEDEFLLTAMFHPDDKDVNLLDKEEKEVYLKSKKDSKAYEIIDEIPYWSNGGGYTNKKRNRLYYYNKASKVCQPITDVFYNVGKIRLNEDKTKAIFAAVEYTDKAPLSNHIYVYDLTSKELNKYLDEGAYSIRYIEYISASEVLFIGSDMKAYGLNENPKFYKMNLNNQLIEVITPDFDRAINNSVGSDCRYGAGVGIRKHGEYIYFITTEKDSSQLNRLHIREGHIEALTTAKGAIDSFDLVDGELYFIGMRGQRLQEVYKLEQNEEVKISQFNDWLYDTAYVAKPEPIAVETSDNVIVDGWVLKPVDFDPNKKYPAILDIHGGPKTVYGEIFYHEMQYWANLGYFVFFCNPRGSDGKGNAFADIRGKYGTIDYDDIMKFTDTVLTKYPSIDQDNVGVTGGSYGGFMTNWIIGHTERFKAAATQRSIANWMTLFLTSDIGYYFTENEIAATPWGNPEKLWWHSPVRYADKIKTPTLIMHSEEDYRCWVAEAYQMFTALKLHDVEARMCIIRGENHDLSRSGRPKNRLKRLEEITNWFETHLK